MDKPISLKYIPLTDSIESYVSSVNNMPMLSHEEETQLATLFKENNDIDAARRLVMSHLRFVVKIARGYNGYGLQQADLIQEGNIGLMKAVKRFNPSFGVRLVSFAVHWVRAEIHEFIIRNWRIVKIATTKAQRKLFFNLRSSKKRLSWLNQKEVNDIAKALGVKPEEVIEMEKRLGNADNPFDGYAAQDNEKTPANYLQNKELSIEQQVEKEQYNKKSLTNLKKAIASLDERSKDIISKRWLTENKKTLHDLSLEYNVSTERIRQIEKNALKKMRKTVNL